jgi:hypothetical protein
MRYDPFRASHLANPYVNWNFCWFCGILAAFEVRP